MLTVDDPLGATAVFLYLIYEAFQSVGKRVDRPPDKQKIVEKDRVCLEKILGLSPVGNAQRLLIAESESIARPMED